MGFKIFPIESALKNASNLLCAWQRHRDYTDEFMGIQTHQSARTWYRHRKEAPQNLTLAELWRACNVLKIPPEDAFALLTSGVECLRGKELKR
jgi:hypothetical protein